MTTDKPICKKCGKIHVTWQGNPACVAHKKRTDPPEPCTKNKMNYTDMCRTHGGKAVLAQRGVIERINLMEAQGEIAELMRECDIPEQHPIDGLLEVVRISGAMVRLLTVKVGELAEDPELREVLEENTKTGDLRVKRVAGDDAFWGLTKDGEMAPHIYVTLLKTWTERYEKACATALSAGIEERRIRLAEDTADTFFAALGKAVAVAGLDSKMRAALNQAIAQELRLAPSNIIDLI